MNKNDCIIRLATPSDYKATEYLTREAFWNVYRPGCTEHYVLHCLRNSEKYNPLLDFVMEINGEIMGHVIYFPAVIKADDSAEIPIMTFGPISIAPKYKRQGYGKVLLDYTAEKAKEQGAGALCMEGNIDFYGKSGFTQADKSGIRYYAVPENEEAPFFLLKELSSGYLKDISGVYHTPKEYFVGDDEAEEFDRQFPPKEKLKLPGQLFD